MSSLASVVVGGTCSEIVWLCTITVTCVCEGQC